MLIAPDCDAEVMDIFKSHKANAELWTLKNRDYDWLFCQGEGSFP